MRDPHFSTQSEPLDDVDRLFARLERAPVPDDLTARVLASTVARSKAMRAAQVWPWMVAGLGAVLLLILAGYLLGASLAMTDSFELFDAILDDLSLLVTAPGDVAAALGEVIPWNLVMLAGLSAAVLVSTFSQLAQRAPVPLRARLTA